MEYMSAGIGSIVLGLTLALCGLYLLTRRVAPAIRRAVKRFDTEVQEILDINLEAPVLDMLCQIAAITNRRDRQWAIDSLYYNGQLPSYVPDGMRDTGAIITVILDAQVRRSNQLEVLRENADRHVYATA